MSEYYSYENDVVISKEKVTKIANGFTKLIKTELPEEALTVDIIDSVLEQIKSIVRSTKLQL